MIIPITDIPRSIQDGFAPYRDLFPRNETFQHVLEYATGLVVLPQPSIRRLAECLVDGPDQSCINKTLTQSPWLEETFNQRRLELIAPHYRGKGLVIGILDTVLIHHPRSTSMYGVYRYWDYVNGCYTKAMQLVTSAISTTDRCDGFDYRIYHRFFKEQELRYLAYTRPSQNETDQRIWNIHLTELLTFHLHQRQFKTQSDLAAEMIAQMEASQTAPDAYAVDSRLFTPKIIHTIEAYGKPWVADSEKSRILYAKGQKFNLETYEAQLPDNAFRPHTITIHGKKRTFWVFTKVVHIHRYGKVRLAIIYYDNRDREGDPIYCFTNQLNWEAKRILRVRMRRWDIEPFHEQIKQFLGVEDSQLRTERGMRRHLYLVFAVNSLLQSLDMSEPVAGLSMEGRREDTQWTFGQRCLRVVLEAFENLIHRVIYWFQHCQMTPNKIFEKLFTKLCRNSNPQIPVACA